MSDVGRSGRPGGAFDLIDHDGRPVSEGSFRGRRVMIFFGFTHCRVVCPRALPNSQRSWDSLHELAERVTPLYITVDPDRDTPDVMRNFLRSYPRFQVLLAATSKSIGPSEAFGCLRSEETAPVRMAPTR